MGSSENDDSEMGYQYRGEMSSGSMFNNKSSSGSGNLFGPGWDPLENFGTYPLMNQYQSGELVPKMMVNPSASPNSNSNNSSREKRRLNPNMNGDNVSENDEKKLRVDSKGKQVNEGSDRKEDYVHMRAKRGQATNSHSLAERVRREKISERMKLLQDLVPGCNKITGKAVMLDEIINYVQSLQQQVEFLSMKLATVNPEVNIDIDRLVFKDVLHSRGSISNPAFGFSHTLNPSHSYSHGNLPGVPATTAQLHAIHPQPVWDNDLHNLLQMGYDVNPGTNSLGPNGREKMDL